MVAFTPVIEPDLPGAFITKHPRDTLTENSENIPFLTGLTYDEGLIKSPRKKISLYSSHLTPEEEDFIMYILFFSHSLQPS